MKNINLVKIGEVTGVALTVVGTIMSAWAGSKKQESLIAQAVADQLKK